MWKEAGEIFLEHPIIGIGNNNLGYYVKKSIMNLSLIFWTLSQYVY